MELVAISSKEQRTDKSTTLRQWLYIGAENYALRLVEDGQMSVSLAAELLDLSIYDLHEKAAHDGIGLGATADQLRDSLGHAAQSESPVAR